MLLVVDAGNTNITLGIYNQDQLLKSFRMTTKMERTSDEYGLVLLNFISMAQLQVNQIKDVIISSVVPKMMHSFTNAIKKYLEKEPLIVGAGIKTGISIRTDNPKEVGPDRIVDAIGAVMEYGADVLVIDFGTATTYDYINEKKEFVAGVTAPGIGISANALWGQTAKLPEIEIAKPKSILAKNTIHSMQAGIVYGYIGQCEYIIKKMKEELNKPDLKVIATGGLGSIIFNETNLIDTYDPELTFKGLKEIYKLNKEENI